MAELNSLDRDLVETAREMIKKRFRQDYHHVGAALRTKSGRIFSAVHVEAHVCRVSVCAEAIAIGMAASTSGDTEIDTIVAVDRNGTVLSPCGMCRELICDFSPSARVIVPGETELEAVIATELLPRKYRRSHRASN